MAGMYEKDQPMKIAELGDSIFMAESTKTPFTRLVKTGKAPVQMLSEWPAQSFGNSSLKGSLDGTDKATWSSTTRLKMEAYAMWMMSDGWMASTLANLTKTAGVTSEKAKQMADDSLLHALQIEKQMLGSTDTRAEAAPSVAYTSRGAFSWLSAEAQAVKPVPDALRPPAACNYSDTLANFTPGAFKAMLEAAAGQIKQSVNLTGFVGLSLKSRMSSWAEHTPDVGSHTATQRFNLNAKDKEFLSIVDFFAFDAGSVKTVSTWNLYCDENTGAAGTESAKSGIFIDLKMWQKCFMQQPSSFIEPPKSGGPRGYHSSVYLLKCLNPQGQMRVVIS